MNKIFKNMQMNKMLNIAEYCGFLFCMLLNFMFFRLKIYRIRQDTWPE